jgi:DNA repair protein RecN (Recombination protein N)
VLQRLTIQGFRTIPSLSVDFSDGFVAVTGETGAGKSILLETLHFVLGDRPSQRLQPLSPEGAWVTAQFVDDTGTVSTVRAEDKGEGRLKWWLNDRAVTRKQLRERARHWMVMQDQHAALDLLRPERQRDLLDGFGGLIPLRLAVSEAMAAYRTACENYAAWQKRREADEADIAYRMHVVQELGEASVKPEEESALVAARRRAMDSMKQQEASEQWEKWLQQIRQQGNQALRLYARVTEGDASLPEASKAFGEALERMTDACRDAEGWLENWQALWESSGGLDAIEDRLALLRQLARKHRCTVDDLPKLYTEWLGALEDWESDSLRGPVYQAACERAWEQWKREGERLREGRREASLRLAERWHAELVHLKMAGARVAIALEERRWEPEQGQADGFETVVFQLATHPSMALGPWQQVASGGELSRGMLALQCALGEGQEGATFVFDEADSGIGGAVAQAVGRRLRYLGEHRQLLVVTHQPQVAALAHAHYRVERGVDGPVLRLLSREERQEEIARMLAGDALTEAARMQASLLMEVPHA